ncbi:Thioredoxin-like [Prevotellaceae bacterium MN60]|nr:Thioredoxin-like [Prevotellaceae bacterium MN60]
MQRTVRSEKQHSITNNRERNFVVRRHIITLLFILVALVGKAQVKSGLNLCLKDEATNDWLIGLFDEYAVYHCEFWGYAEVAKDHIVLTKDGKRKNVKLRKNATIIDGEKFKTSLLTTQFLPDYPTKDTRIDFIDNGYNAKDSVTIVGWLKNMPEEARDMGMFNVEVRDVITNSGEETYAPIDSLGRFTLKMPLLNTSQVFVDWSRSNLSTVLEPGKTYFFFHDFKTGQKLWMGNDVRLQNELLAYPYLETEIYIPREEWGKMDVWEFKLKTDSAYTMAMAKLEETVRLHPNLSQRYINYLKGYYQTAQGWSMMLGRRYTLTRDLPQEYLDYVNKECWQKAVKPYTLYGDFFSLMVNYFDYIMEHDKWAEDWNIYDYIDVIASNDEELSILTKWKNLIIDANAKVKAAPTEEEEDKVIEKANADNADLIKQVNEILQGRNGERAVIGIEMVLRMKQAANVLDSLGADQIIKDIWLSYIADRVIYDTHTSMSPMTIDTLKAMVKNPFCIERIEKDNAHYLTIENREFDKLVIKSSDNLKDISEGEALLKKIIEPYKGKFVLLDIWGTWCGPCKEALSHSTEEYARLKDYDIQYLYLANRSPQTVWETVIREYNVSGPNVAHYNLPPKQQTAIEQYLNVLAWPTYKLFDRNGNLLDLEVNPHDLETLAGYLEDMK